MRLKILNRATLLLFLVTVTCRVTGQVSEPVQPKSPMSNSELLINSTVKIQSLRETVIDNNRKLDLITGTAFYYLFVVDSISIPVLVTNFHNIKDVGLNDITFTLTDTVNKPPLKRHVFHYYNQTSYYPWIIDPNSDLAILPLYPIMDEIHKQTNGFILFIPFTEDVILKKEKLKELSAIEELLMVGYPKGYGDDYNNYPIVRRGTTATPIFSDFDNKEEFLLDIPIYSGSSGSPIVMLDNGPRNYNGSLIIGQTRLMLVGIASQSIDIKMQQTGKELQTENPLNIAVVIKSSTLTDFKPILLQILKAQKKVK